MNKIFTPLFLLVVSLLTSSCLRSGLKDLDTFSGADITGVVGVYYRYIDDSHTIPASGEPVVKQVALNTSEVVITPETGSLTFSVSVPSNFPEAEKANLTQSKLVVLLNISSAAIITPKDGSATLGKPADWSKPNHYVVTAANGDKKDWTVALKMK